MKDKDATHVGLQVRHLSLRQRQVLQHIMQGCHNKTIARRLNIELVTVKMHVGLLFKKLGVTNRTEAAILGACLYFDLVAESDCGPYAPSSSSEFPPSVNELLPDQAAVSSSSARPSG